MMKVTVMEGGRRRDEKRLLSMCSTINAVDIAALRFIKDNLNDLLGSHFFTRDFTSTPAPPSLASPAPPLLPLPR
ncbi:hypothetical protein CDL15_Pgr029082 [Punica granatum]|uniref:Uncharacterized protein n=1 Tax=Punica granatum TaxID=22663 RepID=A0A218XLV2_PUNGR|nr:hypothetical protein CDL15_Pgr029082 [Punica granatum]